MSFSLDFSFNFFLYAHVVSPSFQLCFSLCVSPSFPPFIPFVATTLSLSQLTLLLFFPPLSPPSFFPLYLSFLASPLSSFSFPVPSALPLFLSLPTSLSICVFLTFFSVAHPSLSPSLYFPLSLCLSIARCGFPFLSPTLPYACFVSPSVVSSLTLYCYDFLAKGLHLYHERWKRVRFGTRQLLW